MSAPELARVALAVNDVEQVVGVLTGVLGLPQREARTARGARVPLVGVGRTVLAIAPCGGELVADAERPGVHHIAIAAEDPSAAARAMGLAPAGATAVGLDDRLELELERGATCGVRVRLCEPAPAPGWQRPTFAIDHIGVASEDNARATEIFAGRLGAAVESTQTDIEVSTAIESFTSDRYGVIYHSRPPRLVGGLRVSFLTVGDCELEFLAPIAAQEIAPGADAATPPGPGNTAGDKGAIARFIARSGPGLHHLALRTPDIAATLAALDAAGVELIDREGRPGSRRALIGFVHPRAFGGVLVHLVERDER
ncbi:MAG: VOC family protein [Gammaproteobacteria bacterium]|nr:VOC family protein [Gammaproteobacteria bacterium]